MELSPLRPDQTDDGALYDKLDADKIDADRMARQTRVLVLASIALLLVAGVTLVVRRSSGVQSTPATAERLMNGTVTLHGYRNMDFAADNSCWGSGGYNDLHAGAQILLVNEANVTLATGVLGPGKSGDGCIFAFALRPIPDAKFYQVKVNQRGGPSYSFAELEARNWQVELTIG